MNKAGHIELILGPMFSGKSSEMQRKVRRYQHARRKCLVINYERDNRYSFEDVAATHDKYLYEYKGLQSKHSKQVNLEI
jgi:thymidine kinase